MVYNQISYESPALFVLFQLFFQSRDFQALQDAAELKAGATSDEWAKFIAYVAGFYSNMGNYHSFGHSKFVPEMDQAKFRAIILSNPLYENTQQDQGMYKQYVDRILPLVEREVFSLEKPFSQLGFPEEGGVTGYFSPSMTSADLAAIRGFLGDRKISPLNTRAFKIKQADGQHVFEITIGSA